MIGTSPAFYKTQYVALRVGSTHFNHGLLLHFSLENRIKWGFVMSEKDYSLGFRKP